MKNIIFDLDGTLADSAILTMAALRSIAPKIGFPVPAMELIRKTIGYANPEFYDRLFPQLPTALVRRIGEQVEQEEALLLPHLPVDLLFPGCRALLQSAQGQGMAMYIASTGSAEHVFPLLNTAGIAGFFQRILCGQPDKAHMLHEIIDGRPKADFLMVGDMRKDWEAARANGILSVGACYGYCNRQTAAFDRYIDTPLQLMELLSVNV